MIVQGKHAFCVWWAVAACLIFSRGYAGAEQLAGHVINKYRTMLTELTVEEKTPLAQWEIWLKTNHKRSSAHYARALGHLADDYRQAIIATSKCVLALNKREANYSNDWLVHAIRVFGREYVTKNKAAVKRVIGALHAKNSSGWCKEAQKEVVYQEVNCNEGYRQFTGLFIKFFKSLEKEEQKKFLGLKNRSEAFLKAIREPPLASLIAGGHFIAAKMLAVAEADADPKLYRFLAGHPDLKKPFNGMNALEMLDKLTAGE